MVLTRIFEGWFVAYLFHQSLESRVVTKPGLATYFPDTAKTRNSQFH
jgi:hypothetical protein